jgi:hypothetical protein
MNRDELRSRARAAPPTAVLLDGVLALAPVDGDFGGTWIGANHLGVSVCLVNRHEPLPERDYRSRGLLVRELLSLTGVDRVRLELAASDLHQYRPFELLALDLDGPTVRARWNGGLLKSMEADEDVGLLVSSLYEPGPAEKERRKAFDAIVRGEPTPASFDTFHRSHLPARGPYSTCMHRDEASTVSYTTIQVGHGRVEMAYQPGPPCLAMAPFRSSIELCKRRTIDSSPASESTASPARPLSPS